MAEYVVYACLQDRESCNQHHSHTTNNRVTPKPIVFPISLVHEDGRPFYLRKLAGLMYVHPFGNATREEWLRGRAGSGAMVENVVYMCKTPNLATRVTLTQLINMKKVEIKIKLSNAYLCKSMKHKMSNYAEKEVQGHTILNYHRCIYMSQSGSKQDLLHS